jgi:hypothetical protein
MNMKTDAEILAIERRVLWLSTWIIHNANHERMLTMAT